MTFFLLPNTNKEILNNVPVFDNGVSNEFYGQKQLKQSSKYILYSTFRRKKVIQVWNDMRVNYVFKY